MSGHIVGTGYVNGLGLCYILAGDHPEFLKLKNVKTGYEYYRRRTDISFRPGKHREDVAA